MFGKVNSIGLLGLNAFKVEVEIESSAGLPAFDIVGLADVAVRESRERIRSAFRSSRLGFPKGRVLVNLAPADVKKSGTVHDLAIAVSLMCAAGIVDPKQIRDAAFIGEVSLSGELRRVNGVLPMTILAQKGLKEIYVPGENLLEASAVRGIKAYGVQSLEQLARHFSGKEIMQPAPVFVPAKADYLSTLDFADVRGQAAAKKALEIAAAGGHNVLMIGSPGSGKSMLAKRMPSILPQMTFEESIETTGIHSVAGVLDSQRPLITTGEISLAHNGLLFLDELAEFSRPALEILRQPLEDMKVTISRVSGSITYPSSFMLIGAMNPCPCGYYGHPTRKCICSKHQVDHYLNKISGPLLDRFDIHLEVAPVEFADLSSGEKEESSESIRQRVQASRDIQNKRYEGTGISCNARISPEMIHDVCPMTDKAEAMLGSIFEKLGLSARAYEKILKVARTVADMDGADIIDKAHIAQAVQYRSLDRKYWKS